jgi:hypothetical protein
MTVVTARHACAAFFLLAWESLGCVSPTAVCNAQSARDLGSKDAARWDGGQGSLRRGRVCKKTYSVNDFEADYARGYQATLQRACLPQAAWDAGQRTATQNHDWRAGVSRLELCEKVDAAVPPLQETFVAGFNSIWCGDDHAVELANQHGNNLEPPQHQWMGGCSAERTEVLEQVYNRQYQWTLGKRFGAARMAQTGMELARAGQGLDGAMTAVQACPAHLQRDAVSALQESYNLETDRVASARQREQQRQAVALQQQRRQQSLEHQRFANSRRDFVLGGNPVSFLCRVERGSIAVQMFNRSSRHVSVSGRVHVEMYDGYGQLLGVDNGSGHFSAFGGGEDSDTVMVLVPANTAMCSVSDVQLR